MKIRNILFVLATYLTTTSLSFADKVTYQPGPEGMDVWISSYYDYGDDYGVDDWKLQAGGWGDEYNFLIKFDLTNLPQNATSAVIWMVPYDRGDSSTLVDMYVDLVTSTWDENTGWYNQPSGQLLAQIPAPTLGYWYGIDITSIYNDWKNGVYPNHGFKFRPVSNNNEYSQFLSSDYSTATYRPKLVIEYLNLAFPLANDTPYTATISAVVDHSVSTGFNCPDNVVTAYTGERGELQYGKSNWSTPTTGSSCLGQTLWGFAQNGLAPFSVNGQYNSPDLNGNDLFLFYDGHTGYDYRSAEGTTVYAAAAGSAIPYSDGVKITHPSGYDTYYLHLSSISIGLGQSVLKGAPIGTMGTKDLHFTVKKGTQRIDPYGWKGEPGADPLQIDGKDNVCFWENCE